MANVRRNGASELLIEGMIKGQDDYNEIKRVAQEMIEDNVPALHIKINESNSITSSVIGYLMKAVNKDKVSIHIEVKDLRLYKIFADLNLVEVFNIKKV